MTIKEQLINKLQTWAPEDTAESWDNVGLQVDTTRDIKRVALVLEINLDTWDIIQKYDYDLIISHHPLIFKPLKSVGVDDWTHNVLRYLIQHNIGFYVSHTNLDSAENGVSDALLQQYGLNPKRVRDLNQGYGRVCEFDSPINITDIESNVQVVAQIIPENLTINSIAFMGGSGKSFVHDIVEQGIDFYVTGELGYHEIQYLRQQKKGSSYLVIINLRCLFLILFMTSSILLILRLILLNKLSWD